MIEIKFWFDDMEGIRDFGIMLLQRNISYKLRKKGDFAIFFIDLYGNQCVTCTNNTRGFLDDKNYCNFILSLGKGGTVIEFKAYALKIY